MYKNKSDGTVWTIISSDSHKVSIRRTDEDGCVRMKRLTVDQLYEEFEYVQGSEADQHGN